MTDSIESSSGGIGVVGLIGVVFVTLKLCGVIDWSWWWVTAPFWGPWAFALAVLLMLGLLAFIVYVAERLGGKRND